MKHHLLLICLLSLAACQSPLLTFPGRSLNGEIAVTDSFAFAKDYSLLQLEVNPEKPYSVWLRVVVIDDELYLDAAEARRWHDYLKADSRVRIGLGEKVYPGKAVRVEDESIQARFLPGRTIYRIEPVTAREQ